MRQLKNCQYMCFDDLVLLFNRYECRILSYHGLYEGINEFVTINRCHNPQQSLLHIDKWSKKDQNL